MNHIDLIKNALFEHIKKTFSLTTLPEHIECICNVDPEKLAFGDLSTNAALCLAKALKKNPRDIATAIASTFSHPHIEKIDLAGPGFLNIFFTADAYLEITQTLYQQKESFFISKLEKPLHYNVEFVSANPTGPLHIGHGRGGIIGDMLARILSFIGHRVTKEFYINDVGSQITKFGISVKLRYLEILGKSIIFPEDGYHGEYVKDVAHDLFKEYGDSLKNNPDSFFSELAYKKMQSINQETLAQYGITFDMFFSEQTLHNNNKVEAALNILEKNGFLYEKDGAIWFRSTDFGDDKDRPLKKSDGVMTYTAADVAYIENKAERNFDKLIMVLGQDHHSYVVRMSAIKQALGITNCSLDIILYQLVTLKEGDAVLRMSKRAGTMVTLKDVIDAVGVDTARFFYLNRKADAHLDFDVALAMKKTDENPVYYIQYAFVRTKGLLEKAQAISELQSITAADLQTLNEDEMILVKKVLSLRDLLIHISTSYHVHALSYYTIELAQAFHRYYSRNRIIDEENYELSRSRIIIVTLLHDTLKLCLHLLGLSIPEKM